MLNENAKKWVAALRSGKYQQGQNQLATADGKFCCLGVACEVAIENGQVLVKAIEDDYITYNGRRNYLPPTVLSWLNIKDAAGRYGIREDNGVEDSKCLAEQNDKGKTFLEIADIIESEPEGFFIQVAQ